MKKSVQSILATGLVLSAMNASAAWPENVNVSGDIIGEFSATSGDYPGDSSDLTLHEFYLALDAQLHEDVTGTVSFLYEEDDTDFGLDEGYLTLVASDIWSFGVGKMYLPFGRFNTSMANDPFALELGEINESSIVAIADLELLDVAIYGFNGSVREAGDNTVDSFGASFLIGTNTLNIKLDYISNLGDADGYTDLDETTVDSVAAGYSVSAHAEMDKYMLDFEFLSALDPVGTLAMDDGSVNTYGEVESVGIELGMTLGESCECSVAFGIQSSDNAAGLLPESRISLGYMRPVFEVLTLNTELYFDKDYDAADGGSDESGAGLLIDLIATF